MPRGRLITFEGGEGAGKSTQIKLLAGNLESAGHKVIVTREPGGTRAGELLRDLLVRNDAPHWSPEAEALLNYAARDSHLREVIRPALSQGIHVVCDRFIDSTRVYQAVAGGCSQKLIDCLQREIAGPTLPDITFVFDLDPMVGLQRAASRMAGQEDRFERKDEEFHNTVRLAFLEIARSEPERCRTIDAAQPPDVISSEIYKAVAQLLQA